jgi:hypothetical protein
MSLIAHPPARRKRRTARERFRRFVQQLGPYPSLVLLCVPVAMVEPLKVAALVIAGKGHWLSGTATIVAAYAMSLLVVERLFRLVKPKLLMLKWFAAIWSILESVRSYLRSVTMDRRSG